MWIIILLQLWTATPHLANVLLEGNWQSCNVNGNYEERVFDYCPLGKCRWSFHMGPQDEFALFTYETDPPIDDHSSPFNLLAPGFDAARLKTWGGKRNWTVPALHLWVSVAQAGGSLVECQSYYVKITRTP